MRKAVQAAARRNQRRKEGPAPPPPPAEAPPVAGSAAGSAPQEQPATATGGTRTAATTTDASKRKATPEETALTAKNYRLAKELVSDAFVILCIYPVFCVATEFKKKMLTGTRQLRIFPRQSELRVRHREECKNVTRLTMENVSSTTLWRYRSLTSGSV